MLTGDTLLFDENIMILILDKFKEPCKQTGVSNYYFSIASKQAVDKIEF